MQKIVATGNDFANTRRNSNSLFVDKTLLIKTFLDSGDAVTLITRPRRFGKTFNLSMLYHFLSCHQAEDNRSLFANTLVERATCINGESCMRHQGQYPTITLTLKDIRSTTWEDMLDDIQTTVIKLYQKFLYLEHSDHLDESHRQSFKRIINRQASSAEWRRSLQELTELLHLHHNTKPIVLIDEYDTPIHSAYTASTPFDDDVTSFFSVWLGSALKDNPHLERGLVTGILRVAMMNLFSGVNSIPADTVLHTNYQHHFGFTENEVIELLNESHLADRLPDIKNWYNGYHMGGKMLYNPWSVLSCIRQGGELGPYWSGSGDHGTLARALMQCQDLSVMEGLASMLKGQSIEVSVDERTLLSGLGNAASIWGLMIYAGYLNGQVCSHIDQLRVQVSIPNLEVQSDLKTIIRQWVSFDHYPKTRALAYQHETSLVEGIHAALEHGNTHHLQELLQSFLDEAASYHDFPSHTDERFYHVFLLGMMVLLQDRYEIHSNKEMGLGRFDIALAPKSSGKHGVLIELKRSRTPKQLPRAASQALQQIEDKRYNAFFRRHQVTQALHIGLAFCGKQVNISQTWVNYDRE